MQPARNKRVTQYRADEVPLLQQPLPVTKEAVSSPPKLKSEDKGTIASSARLPKRAAASSLIESSRKVIRGAPRALALPDTKGSRNDSGSDLVVREEPPWDTFKKYYECDLAGTVAVCVRRSGRRGVWAIRQHQCKDADRILEFLRSTSHKNVLSAWECFRTSDALYILTRFHPLTLDHVVASKAYPDQQQLAAIMSQVHSLVHGHTQLLIIHSSLMDYHISLPKIYTILPWIVLAS